MWRVESFYITHISWCSSSSNLIGRVNHVWGYSDSAFTPGSCLRSDALWISGSPFSASLSVSGTGLNKPCFVSQQVYPVCCLCEVMGRDEVSTGRHDKPERFA